MPRRSSSVTNVPVPELRLTRVELIESR